MLSACVLVNWFVRDGLCTLSRSVEERVFEVEITRAFIEAVDVETTLTSRVGRQA